jgi:signal transduction histidine kinase
MISKILIVDDKPENLYSLECMLAGEGREIVKASGGNEALRIALQEDIALILLDVQMPEMDGYEVAAMLQSTNRTRKIPIVFVTAISTEREYMLRGLNSGAVDYLFKPLDTEITRAKVSTLLKIQQQQAEIEQMNAQLTTLNKEKNFFLGMAAHDLRNPIGNILTLASMLRDELQKQLNEEQITCFDMMTNTSNQMLELLDNLLDISKIESGAVLQDVRTHTLEGLLMESIGCNRKIAAKKNIQLHCSLREEHTQLCTDRRQFSQILNNLVSNALKYSPSGSVVEITAEVTENEVRIHVKDQGAGIPPEEHYRVFSPFARTSVETTAGESSTGLGLSIVKRLLESNGGRIWFESSPGAGSVFSFSLPLCATTIKTL